MDFDGSLWTLVHMKKKILVNKISKNWLGRSVALFLVILILVSRSRKEQEVGVGRIRGNNEPGIWRLRLANAHLSAMDATNDPGPRLHRAPVRLLGHSEWHRGKFVLGQQ